MGRTMGRKAEEMCVCVCVCVCGGGGGGPWYCQGA